MAKKIMLLNGGNSEKKKIALGISGKRVNLPSS
jgi:hypothetical protein